MGFDRDLPPGHPPDPSYLSRIVYVVHPAELLCLVNIMRTFVIRDETGQSAKPCQNHTSIDESSLRLKDIGIRRKFVLPEVIAEAMVFRVPVDIAHHGTYGFTILEFDPSEAFLEETPDPDIFLVHCLRVAVKEMRKLKGGIEGTKGETPDQTGAAPVRPSYLFVPILDTNGKMEVVAKETIRKDAQGREEVVTGSVEKILVVAGLPEEVLLVVSSVEDMIVLTSLQRRERDHGCPHSS